MSDPIPQIDWDNDPRIEDQHEIPCKSLPPLVYFRAVVGDKDNAAQSVHRLLCVFQDRVKVVETVWMTETKDPNENTGLDSAIFKLHQAWKRFQENRLS